MNDFSDDAVLQRLEDTLRQHAELGCKRSGGTGDHGTADWLENQMRALGIRPKRTDVAVPTFEPHGIATLQLGEQQVPVWPQPVVVPTSNTGVTAPLALVLTPEHAAKAGGRIALILPPEPRYAALWTPTLQRLIQAAVGAGAVAVVLILGVDDQPMALNTRTTATQDIPLAILAPAHAEPFLAATVSGRAATLTIAGHSTHGRSPNLTGQLRRGPSWLALSTPRTGWFDCVSERGTGTAVWLELARWFPHHFPEHSLFLMNTGGHEFDFSGTHAVMQEAPHPSVTSLWTHIGSSLATRQRLAFRGQAKWLSVADPDRMLMATESLREHATQAFRDVPGLDDAWPVQTGAGELSTMVSHGYPRAFAVLGRPGHFHTAADTLESVDARLLLPVLRAHQRLISATLAPDS